MNKLEETLTLHNGVEIPVIGFGTWLIKESDAPEIVLNALKAGYRHIDTAEAYGNEHGVGLAIRNSGIPREDIFLQTKVIAECKEYDWAVRQIEESFKKLNVDYIDLMIIHCPTPWKEYRSGKRYDQGNLEVWKALSEYYKAGKIKSIGVSNFDIEDIENIIKHSDIKPMVNQIPVYISNVNKELVKYCEDNDIIVEAYSPLGHGKILNHPIIKEVADKYHVSTAQLCVRYTLQLGMVSLPKASSIEHIKNNADVDFNISDEDMEILDKIEYIPIFDY